MRVQPLRLAAVAISVVLIGAVAPAFAQSSTLPNGASSVNETYQDWRVTCVQQQAVKRCVAVQVQVQPDGQRVLAVELNAPSGGIVTGTLVLPFGLAFDNGVTLQLDERAGGAPLRFRTCLPSGCLVPLSLDAALVAAMRGGTALKVKAKADGGSDVPLSISLQGFAAALDRASVLSR